MTAYQAGKVVPLTERAAAPRHDDEKTRRIVEAAIESALQKHDNTVISEMRAIAARVEKGFNRLADSMEAFVSGDREVAVAALTSTKEDDLPSLSTFKASALIVYPLKASDIAERLGLAPAVVAYLLNKCGLNWAARKPELWDKDLYEKAKRRFWHERVVQLLREVILSPDHPERAGISTGCERALNKAREGLTPRGGAR
jgi:hypothetical protein